MNPRPTRPVDHSGWYEVRLGGRLTPRWSTWLDGVRARPAPTAPPATP